MAVVINITPPKAAKPTGSLKIEPENFTKSVDLVKSSKATPAEEMLNYLKQRKKVIP